MKTIVTLIIFIVVLAAAFLAPKFMDKKEAENIAADVQFKSVRERNQWLTRQKRIADLKSGKTQNNNSFTVGTSLPSGQKDPNDPKLVVIDSKNFLLKQVDRRIQELDPFKIKMEKSIHLSDQDKKTLVAELSDEIDAFNSLKAEINQSESKDDVMKVTGKIKQTWIKSRVSVQRSKELLVATGEMKILSDADAASIGIKNRITQLKESGKDTKDHETLLSKYEAKINSAKQDLDIAKQKSDAINSAKTEAEKQKLVEENADLLRDGKANIKDAYKVLTDGARQDFYRRMNQKNSIATN